MLPADYQLPAAIVILIGGLISCFFGYRLFRAVLAIVGFILGAFIASSFFGVSDTIPMIAAAAVGGLVGAAILFFAYFLGVSLMGAAMGALLANVAFSVGNSDPRVWVVIGLSILGAAIAMYLQRYCLIVGTAFLGAWMVIVGAAALIGDRGALTAAISQDVWVVYPLNPAPGQSWVPLAWVALSVVGAVVQLATGGERGRVHRRKPKKS